MNIFALIIAGLSFLFGIATLKKNESLLFYKMVVLSVGSYLLATIYRLLYAMLIPTPAFHAGYLTYAGAFFFLLGAFFTESKSAVKKQSAALKTLALLPTLIIILFAIWNIEKGHSMISQSLLIPVAITAHYTFRSLLQKGKPGEYPHAFRPFHLMLLCLCLIQPIMLVSMLTRENTELPILFHSLFLASTLISAYRGCNRWSM